MAGTTVAELRAQIAAAKKRITDPQAFARWHAEKAREALAEVQAREGVRPTTVIVDGRRGASEDSVRPFGVIAYEISPLADVVDAVWNALIQASPIGPGKTGHYKDAHWLFVNGQRVDVKPGGDAPEIPPGSTCMLVNTKPYARKLEVGFGHWGNATSNMSDAKFRAISRARQRRHGKFLGRSGLSVQAPDGVYEITARAMAKRFGNQAEIEFTYEALEGQAVVAGKRGNRSELRYPAIIITER